MNDAGEPIACSLTTAAAADQVMEWGDLRRHVLTTEALPQGAVMTFGLDVADVVEDLATREAQCCAFLAITTTRTATSIRLEITSENPDARPVIEALAGISGA